MPRPIYSPITRNRSRSGPFGGFSVLRLLFPKTRQKARSRINQLKYETIPYYKYRAQSRIYKFICRRQTAKSKGRPVLSLLRKLRGQALRRVEDDNRVRRTMNDPARLRYTGNLDRELSYGNSESVSLEGRERGARRRKLAGYLKAANELRQSYQQAYGQGWTERDGTAENDGDAMPGSHPDVAVVRSGEEEMMLFPSYARRHFKSSRPVPTDPEYESHESKIDISHSGDSKFCEHHNESAVVDVDVRGWIYAPHRGPLTRKNRLLIGIARKLSGIPAPPGMADGLQPTDTRRMGSAHHERAVARAARTEEEIVSREAESIQERGEGEADIAWHGGYSEGPGIIAGRSLTTEYYDKSGVSTPGSQTQETQKADERQDSVTGEVTEIKPISQRVSFQSTDMTAAELRTANSHLMARLKPFLSLPLNNIPITIFFFNNQTSQSRTVTTNDTGHFSVRAALDFVPTDVRVLASDNLSATEEVRFIESEGISLISDIDDTIKHSAVGDGAREIFRNTFVRELGDLTIDGVREWYKNLADLGVKIHYVSNSPWQLYPLLSSYFSFAGLPPGSFHLKQYSGMLQGIFEPVAERKKGTLEKIMGDFPDRKFLLVGDSGEADLEVYTDIVLANPNRVIGVFIRDVTTPQSQGFFDSAMGSLSGDSKSDGNKAAPHLRQFRSAVSDESSEHAPPLPERKSVPPASSNAKPSKEGILIDLGNDDDGLEDTSKVKAGESHQRNLKEIHSNDHMEYNSRRSGPPPRPSKPAALRSSASLKQEPPESPDSLRETVTNRPPPLPSAPRPAQRLAQDDNYTPGHRPVQMQQSTWLPESGIPGARREFIRQKVAAVYNNLPSASAYFYGEEGLRGSATSSNVSLSSSDKAEHNAELSAQQSVQPARRGLASYPAAAAQYASSRLPAGWGGSEQAAEEANLAQANRREEMWKRRWAKAKEILDDHGVELRSWRVGGDIMHDCVKLVENELKKRETRERQGEK